MEEANFYETEDKKLFDKSEDDLEEETEVDNCLFFLYLNYYFTFKFVEF